MYCLLYTLLIVYVCRRSISAVEGLRLLRVRFHLIITLSQTLLSSSPIEAHRPSGSFPVEELFIASLTLLMMTSSSYSENGPCCSDWLLICFHVFYQVHERSYNGASIHEVILLYMKYLRRMSCTSCSSSSR